MIRRVDYRLIWAWVGCQLAAANRGIRLAPLERGFLDQYGVSRLEEATPAQSRHLRRQLNAYRGALEGRPTIKPATARKYG